MNTADREAPSGVARGAREKASATMSTERWRRRGE
jgi:hypothetical protein